MNRQVRYCRPPLAATALSFLISACNGGLIAPEGPRSNAFLTQIDQRCGHLTIGSQPLGYLIDQSQDNSYFLDEASRLSAGLVSRDTFASDINAFYLGGNNKRALACIFAQLEGDSP